MLVLGGEWTAAKALFSEGVNDYATRLHEIRPG